MYLFVGFKNGSSSNPIWHDVLFWVRPLRRNTGTAGIFFFDLIPKVGKSDIDIRASPYLLRGYEITYNHSSCMGQNSSTPVGMGLSETNIPLKGNHIVPT